MTTLTYDPVPWLMKQDGLQAVRARRSLCLEHADDLEAARATLRELSEEQLEDGSWEHSLLKTAGVLNLLGDLRLAKAKPVIHRACAFLLDVLEAQDGYARAKEVSPGTLKTACDLCGFFGPYADRAKPSAMAQGAREMNFYREYEPLLGPKSPVREKRRSSLDRAGPSSCYSWGLIPLAYAVETLCRADHWKDERLAPALNALLGAQRDSGGWCRNLSGYPTCTLHGLKAVGSHPQHRKSPCGERALQFLQSSWHRCNVFSALQATAQFDSPSGRSLMREMLASAASKQRKDGSFGTPCSVERVAAVLAAERTVQAG